LSVKYKELIVKEKRKNVDYQWSEYIVYIICKGGDRIENFEDFETTFDPLIERGYLTDLLKTDKKKVMKYYNTFYDEYNKLGIISSKVYLMGKNQSKVEEIKKLHEKEKGAKLKADIILVSDTGMLSNDTPSITTGLRGLSYVEVEVIGPNRDLHSGLYGGCVANPINMLTQMIASLHDENMRITIPGFYDKVIELSNNDRAEMAKAPFSEPAYCEALDIRSTHGEKGYSTMERGSIRPTLDVNGIWGGYTGEGAKTVIAAKAFAKISMRLVPDQDPIEITNLFQKHFQSIAPLSVRVKVTPHHGGEPVLTPTDSSAYAAASRAYETTFGKKPIPVRSGGSIPIIAMFEQELGLKTILMGFGLDSDAIHSPNEHFGLFNYFKGIETIPYFYKYFSEINA
jgi:acetylornithine deacetylase/succinyl-diaminopimelate desuccinylase-like protein